eukprot:gene6653-7738_t
MRLARVEQLRLAPLAQADDDGKQGQALGREHVFLVGRAVRGGRDRKNALFHQRVQAVGQDVLRHAQAFLEFPEAAHAVKGVAHDQERPALTDRVERARHGTGVGFQALALGHGHSPGLTGCILKLPGVDSNWF